MKILFAGSYIPRKCGIATFTHSLARAVAAQGHEAAIIALSDGNQYDYPPEVVTEIKQNSESDYIAAAAYANNSGADLCCIQHEYGIFGGDAGSYICQFTRRLEIPYIVTLHTVLDNPDQMQLNVVRRLAAGAAGLVVMTELASTFLTEVYKIPAHKISVIPHGVPEFTKIDNELARKLHGLEGKTVLSTFGLLGRNKGIETVLKAMPSLLIKHPNLHYLVIGKTHPHVIRHEGESYRNELITLARELGIAENVQFIDRFVDEEELFILLQASHIYITPYHNLRQITSGTLSYALGAGCVVMSTPYWHAEEILGSGKGILFREDDHIDLAFKINHTLSNPDFEKQLRHEAVAYGQTITWPATASIYLQQFEDAVSAAERNAPGRMLNTLSFPRMDPGHLESLTDQTGLIQHARYGVPDYTEGYCIDDNARGLLYCSMAAPVFPPLQKRLSRLSVSYLSFIHYMQREDGRFRNFLGFDRNFIEELGSEDSFGRTMWALGSFLNHSGQQNHTSFAREIFRKAMHAIPALHHIRPIANVLLGLCEYYESGRDHEEIKIQIGFLAKRMAESYKANTTGDWHWYEDILTYDNALLPLAMLKAGGILNDNNILDIGFESAAFLEKICYRTGCFSPVGNEGWFRKGSSCALFAQQPVDTMMQVLLFETLYQLTRDYRYKERMKETFDWFTGANVHEAEIAIPSTGACYDGLESYGVNLNQGAESTLAYLIALTVMHRSFSSHTSPPLARSRRLIRKIYQGSSN